MKVAMRTFYGFQGILLRPSRPACAGLFFFSGGKLDWRDAAGNEWVSRDAERGTSAAERFGQRSNALRCASRLTKKGVAFFGVFDGLILTITTMFTIIVNTQDEAGADCDRTCHSEFAKMKPHLCLCCPPRTPSGPPLRCPALSGLTRPVRVQERCRRFSPRRVC